MTQTLHLGSHPDAERVSCFLEHSLSEDQRLAFLDHLADCERCREVTWLAREAAAAFTEPAQASVSVHSSPAAGERSLHVWHFAWIAGAAVAAMITLVIALRLRPAAPQQVAQVVSGERGGLLPRAPEEGIDAGHTTKQPQAPVHDSAANRVSHSAKHLKDGSTPQDSLRPSEASSVKDSGGHATPMTGASDKTTVDGQPFLPRQDMQATMDKFGLTPPIAVAPASRPAIKTKNTTKPPLGSLASAAPSPAGHAAYFSSLGAAGTVRTHKNGGITLAPRLPSGLLSASTARSETRIITVDFAGNVFVHNSEGAAWEAVTPQWSGYAVEVRLATHKKIAAGLQAPPNNATESFFELVNDVGAIWVSRDGSTWTPK